MRRHLSLLFVLVAITSACGGKSSSSGSNGGTPDVPAPTAPSASAPANNTVTGRIVTNPGNNGIAGATLDVQGTRVTTDGSGNFSVPASGQDRKVSVNASGYLGRETWLRSGSRNNIVIDLISTSSPFSLDFYRTIARGAGSTSLQPLRRWNENPNFYIRTTDQAGQEVAVASVDIVERTIRQSIPQITGGRLNVGRIERGSAARSMTAGWINIDLTTDLNYNYCGTSLVGGNPGRMLLNATTRNKCGQETPAPVCVAHELGHAMGLWHTPAPTTMQAVPGMGTQCAAGDFTAAEKYHSAILYSRPKDNMDTDIDPGSFQLLTPQSASDQQALESCPLSE